MIRLLRRGGATLLLGLALASLSACGLAPETGGTLDRIETLDARADSLRAQFNRDFGKVRLLFVLDPACATCLRGLADLDRDLLASLPDSVAVYLVHANVIGGNESHIPGAAVLVHHAGARHYWDPSGAFGRAMGESLPLTRRGRPVFAWDVWMLYGPDADWTDRPPQPNLLMHQLPSIDDAAGAAPLDSQAFAEATRALMARQPDSPGR